MRDKIKNINYQLAKFILLTYVGIVLFAPFINGDKAILMKKDGTWSSPVFSNYFGTYNSLDNTQDHKNASFVFMPLIPYSSKTIDSKNQGNVGPFDEQAIESTKYRHWLGVDKLGRDVTAGMINGTRIAIMVGCVSVLFSFLIGVFLGMVAGYFGNIDWKLNFIQVTFGILTSIFFLYVFSYEFLIFQSNIYFFLISILMSIGLITLINHYILSKLRMKKYAIPLDLIIMKGIELRKSIPGLFLILSLVSVFSKPSLWNIILIITLLGWTEFARFARSETLGIRNEAFILSARLIGFDHFRILRNHILPNILPTLLVVICFNVSSAILLESSLSFLGIGLPVEEVTWGKMMSEGRNMRSWWLVVFPGLAIFSIILSLNIIASNIQEKLSAK